MSEEKENPSKMEQMKDKANAAYQKASAKADELYNKLPLDSINEKLASKGIKIDVKSRKFKLALAGVAAFLVILLLWFSCRGGKDDGVATGNFSESYVGYVSELYSDAKLAFIKSAEKEDEVFTWIMCIKPMREASISFPSEAELKGKSFEECLKMSRAVWGEEGEKIFQEKLARTNSKYNDDFETMLDGYRFVWEERNRHLHYIQDNFVSCFNQRLGEIGSTLQVVSLESVTFSDASETGSGEVWKGSCKLRNTKTGAEFQENFACMLEWDKSGDKKYKSLSYDRPIRLEWLWLHDFGQNNYLSDPRY